MSFSQRVLCKITKTPFRIFWLGLSLFSFLCWTPSTGRAFEVINSSLQDNVPVQSIPSAKWSVTTLPVGHGDAHIISSSDGQISLVDTASTETVELIVEYLRKNGIQTIERIIVTHPHWDHIGGLSRLIDTFHVKKIIRPDLHHSTNLVERTENKIKKKDIPIKSPKRGDTFSVGKNTRAKVIHPGASRYNGLNPNSLAFHFSVGETRILMMGDVIGNALEDLLNNDLLPRTDIVKLAHHGNARGTTKRFLETVNPKFTIISAPLRKHDPWDRPDRTLIKRLNNYDIPTFRTGKSGRIQVIFNKKFVESISLGPTTSPASDGLEAHP